MLCRRSRRPQLNGRFTNEERRDMEAVAWHGFENNLSDLMRAGVLGIVATYAAEFGGIDELREAHRQFKIAQLQATIADLEAKMGVQGQ